MKKTTKPKLYKPWRLFLIFVLVLIFTILFFRYNRTPKIAPTIMIGLISYVDPFIGTTGNKWTAGGKVFPGAVLPFGMIAWSPDTESHSYSGGYDYKDKKIRHFSVNHFSGTSLATAQQIPIMPYVGTINKSPYENTSLYYSNFSHKNEIARPGYYQVFLSSISTNIELTTTERTGFGKITFPKSKESQILINKNGTGYKTGLTDANVTMISDTELSGFSEQFIVGKEKVFFYIVFDRPFKSINTWKADLIFPNSRSVSGTQSGAFVTFDTSKKTIIQMKIGISYVSSENAKENLITENPSWDFDDIKISAQKKWESKLKKILVKGSEENMKIFYTALYHAFMHPSIFSDANGEYRGFDEKTYKALKNHNQYHYFANWDLYRSQIQLLSILEPSITSDMMQSLVNLTNQGSIGIPTWQVMNRDYKIMRGDSGIPVITSSYAFGARDFDEQDALAKMVSGQEHNRPWGYKEYINQGYIPGESDMFSASASLEYYLDDYNIAIFAKYLGKKDICEFYLKRSENWKKIFNPDNGYIQAKLQNGSWATEFSPSNPTSFQEGTSEIYTWLIPHDIKELVQSMGGNKKAVKKLAQLHQNNESLVGNQPNHISSWLYNFISAPSLTQKQIRKNLQVVFKNKPDGLLGDDDGGSTSSWFIFSSLGLYPVIPGIAGFTISSPIFTSAQINLENGSSITINAPYVSEEAIYIKDMNLNGKNYSKLWLPWDKLKNGATLDFKLSSSPDSWGKSPNLNIREISPQDLCKPDDARIQTLEE